jgi:hypothetical protein
MQREGRVDAQRRRRVLAERAARGGEVGVADRRRGAEPVEAAAQDHQHQPVRARTGGAGEGEGRPGGETAGHRGGGGEEPAAGRALRGSGRCAGDRSGSWPSSCGRSATLEFGCEQQQGEGLRAVGGALDLAGALGAEPGPEAFDGRRRASTLRPARSATRVAHSTRFQTASGPSQSSPRSLQPAGDGAAITRWPSENTAPPALTSGRSNMRSPAARRRAVETTNSSGVFSFAGDGVHAASWWISSR